VTNVMFPLVPGNPPYVPPAPRPVARAPVSVTVPTPAVKSAADSAAAAATTRVQALGLARRESLRAYQDSLRAGQRPQPVQPDTSGTYEK